MGSYNLSPYIQIAGYDSEAFSGYSAILAAIQERIKDRKKTILTCEFYPGVDREEVLSAFQALSPDLIVDSESCAKEETVLNQIFAEDLTEDRVFGRITGKRLPCCFEQDKLMQAREKALALPKGLVLIFGTGASLIHRGDLLLYFDMERWEIQMRYRSGMPNWHCTNTDAPVLSKYKRGFFVEWRMADIHKKALFSQADYFVDTGTKDCPNMLTAAAFFAGHAQTAHQPFRTVPYFDPGVWGGQWMKEKFQLPPQRENYAWSFDGVPEENTLQLKYGQVLFKQPCINLVFLQPVSLLGDRVHARFGTEFPIRFDLLDTMGGDHLSLQVHPLTEYIQENFHMHYTQDESYYILDAGEDGCVYIGLKENVDKEEMIADLRLAQTGEISFPAEKYINKIPVKTHDHILIPAGTIHCSSKDTMVLEISATPYIFTFKLWDWDRLGLDGLPRPIHLEHGLKNIQWERDLPWVKRNLMDKVETLTQTETACVQRTGLHEREFIDVFRHCFTGCHNCHTKGSVNVLSLVEGQEITVSSTQNRFPDFTVHYGETFIIPAAVTEYMLRTESKTPVFVLQAMVRA